MLRRSSRSFSVATSRASIADFSARWPAAKNPISTSMLPTLRWLFWMLKARPLKCSNEAHAIRCIFQVFTQGRRPHMDNQTKSKLSRRNFLLAAGVGGVATVAAVAGRTMPAEEPKPVTSNDKRRGKGYQESAHVRSYYNTTKV